MNWPACLSGLGAIIAIVIVVLCVLILLGGLQSTPLILLLCILGLAIARVT